MLGIMLAVINAIQIGKTNRQNKSSGAAVKKA
jgi:hypothetical protein